MSFSLTKGKKITKSATRDRLKGARTGSGTGAPVELGNLSKNGKSENGQTQRPSQSNLFDGASSSVLLGLDESQAFSPQLWKRIFDVSCVILTLPFWLPLIILIMAYIRLTSPGPIFYRQARVGYRKSQFMIFKFRTMRVNADTRPHEDYFAKLTEIECPMTKLDAGDGRLIRGGRFLRASGLDELPQIFNVLRGEMSLVGPRPCLPNEFSRYEISQQERFDGLPGLTGYWQVNGKNQTTFKEMIALDIFYIRNATIWLDLKIILKTFPTLAQEIQSYRKPGAGRRPPASAKEHVLSRSSGNSKQG
jgi:lipopolysaccharide/colanic/teichoic acid biosynthesis glycosyltransferase